MNDVERTAYESFRAQYTKEDFDCMFCGKSVITVWFIQEREKVAMPATVAGKGVDASILHRYGFTEKADCQKVFTVNRKKKCIKWCKGAKKDAGNETVLCRVSG